MKSRKSIPQEHSAQTLVQKEEQPYEIPEGWVWVKLSAICEYIRAGGDKPKNFSKTKTDIYKIPVIANGVSNEGIIGYTDIETEKKNTVTVSGRGTIGFSLFRDYPYCPIVRLIVLAPSKIILPLFLKSAFDNFCEEGVGTSIPQLTVPMIKNKAIPLPPLHEQQRIVSRIESLFEKLNRADEIIKNVFDKFSLRKAAVLHQAFTGELTEKWRQDSRKEKVESRIAELPISAFVPKEEQPYEIPRGWMWVRLGEVVQVIMGQSPKGEDTTDNSNYIGLIGGASDMGEMYPNISRYTMKPTKKSKINDIIISVRATLGDLFFLMVNIV